MASARQLQRVVATILAAAGAGTAAAQTYKFVQIDSTATNAQPYAVNASSQTVGWAVTDEGNTHAHYWFNGEVTDLDNVVHFDLVHPYFGLGHHQAFDISNGGQVVGTARLRVVCDPVDIDVQTSFILMPAVLSDFGTPFPGDALVNLRTFGDLCLAHDSTAVAISNTNHVVGWADLDSPAGAVHAYLVTPSNGDWYIDVAPVDGVNDLMIDLGTLDSESSVSAATNVNDAGVVVGYSYTRTGTLNNNAAYHAFRVVPAGGLWFVDGNADGINDLMEDIGTLGGLNSWARGINNAGVIVGEAETAAAYTRAFSWSGGVMTDLGTLGGRNSSASAINEDGVIVGWSEDARGVRKAVAWINGQIRDLNTAILPTDSPGMTMSEARDVNENGVIVGWGDAGGENGAKASFQLRLASAAEIAEANAVVAGTTAGSGSGSAGSGGGSATGDDGDVLIPVDPESAIGNGSGGAGTGAAADGGTPSPTTSLCGAGFAGLIPFTALGIAALARRPQRRRHGR